MSSDSLPSVPTLKDKEKYNIWLLRFRYAACAAGVWAVFDGTQVPADADPNLVRRMLEKAQALLSNALEADDLLMVQPFMDTPAAALEALTRRYQAVSAATLHQLLTKWTGLQMGEGETVLGLSNRVRDLAQRLQANNHPMTEHVVCITLLHALPDSFRNVREVLLVAENLTMDRTVNHLLEVEVRQKHETETRALLAGSGNGGGGGRKKKSPTCWECGEIGHVKNKCPKLNNKGAGTMLTMATAMLASGGTGDKFIIDSGATQHMVLLFK